MVTEDQGPVIDFLTLHLASGAGPVERIETHSAIVFLAGAGAWKLKRAVRFDYLDFSTVERRRQMCEAEVRLNRRTAAQLYRGVVPVTREDDGTLALNGAGTAADWLVAMRRFDQRDLCERRAAEGTLDLPTIEHLAMAVASFHASAARRHAHGGHDAMAWVVDGNATGFAEFGSPFLDREVCERVTLHSRQLVDEHRSRLDRRRAQGYVRQCHGDLHLRNIVLLEGQPTLFDGVEFNDDIACIDVWYDLAFLLMDLLHRDLPRHANLVFNRYLAETKDVEALPLLPLFLSCRAAIRAKTSATAAAMKAGHAQATLRDLSRTYLTMADQLLHPRPPALIAVGGLSGTGKSTVASRLAPGAGAAPGAAVLRSDEVRKELCGVSRLAPLGSDAYTPEVSARVYATLRERAHEVLRAGHSVIVDAVHARAVERDAIAQVAAALSVPFAGLWLDAPAPVLIERVGRREHDASDADAAVVDKQLEQPLGAISWRRLDAARPIEAISAEAREFLARAITTG